MIILDVGEDLGGVGIALRCERRSDVSEQPRLQRIMDDQVSPLADRNQVGGFGGVAAYARRATLIIKPIADGGPDRVVIDLERRHRKAAAPHHNGRLARDRKRPRRRSSPAGWHDLFAVMRNSVAVIERISGVETRHDLFDTFGAINRQWGGACTASPMVQHQRADPVDMVRMEMGQQQSIDVSGADPHQVEIAIAVLAHVDHQHLLARNHDIARPRTLRIDHGRAGATQPDMKPVIEAGQLVASRHRPRRTLEKRLPDTLLEQECRSHDDGRYQQKPESDSLHH